MSEAIVQDGFFLCVSIKGDDDFMETMRALVKHHRGEGAIFTQVPQPEMGPNEVKIQVKNTSICGTDVHIYAWDDWAKGRVKPPYVFGHEFSGVVVAVGEQVSTIEVGDHVSAETHIVCGQCTCCRRGESHICLKTKIIGVDRDGCFTEYVVLPEGNCWKNSKEIPFEIASLMEPLGNAVHTALSGDIVSRTVAVMGCGPIGLMAVAVAKASGASKVIAIDPNDYRLHLAEAIGADHCVSPYQEDPVAIGKSLTRGDGVDVLLEMSGHPLAFNQGLEMLIPGGRISVLGIPTRPIEMDVANQVVFKGIQIHGISGRRMYQTWDQMAKLLESNRISLDMLITHRLALEEYEEGFRLMQSGNCGKVVFSL